MTPRTLKPNLSRAQLARAQETEEATLPRDARHRADGFVEPWRHRSFTTSYHPDRRRRER